MTSLTLIKSFWLGGQHIFYLAKQKKYIKSVFDSVVAVTFQIAFRVEIHANDVFSFFKNHF